MPKLPMPVPGSNSTKERIIELLGEEWPLPPRSIYLRLRKKHLLPLTYQAVYKAVRELVQKGVLEKSGSGYRINQEWIQNIGAYAERMHREFAEGRLEKSVKTVQRLAFARHMDFIKHHMAMVGGMLRAGERVRMTFHFRHVPYPFIFTGEEYEQLKRAARRIDWTIRARSATPLDVWCARYWRKLGVKVLVGADTATNGQLIVTNDQVAYVYLPPQAIRVWDRIFETARPDRMDVTAMNETLLTQEFKTVVTMIRDREIAALINGER